MTKSKIVYKRMRPAMGTYLKLAWTATNSRHDLESLANEVFSEAERLERIFTKYNPLLGREGTPEFCQLATLAENFTQMSEGAFVIENGDYSGVAKGFIVDRLVEWVNGRAPDLEGSIEAGGDLRALRGSLNFVSARLPEARGFRTLHTLFGAMAGSSTYESVTNPKATSTLYNLPLQRGLREDWSVFCLAGDCATADAMTKVGLFASARLVRECAQSLVCEVLVLDGHGQLQEHFGST